MTGRRIGRVWLYPSAPARGKRAARGTAAGGGAYAGLAEKLGVLGTAETERNLANKISHGGFTAAFLIQCLEAIGCHSLRLQD